jgi:hypothetical protein
MASDPSSPTEETFLPETPIYAHLAELWRREGRTVPGSPDPECDRLTRHPPGSPTRGRRPGRRTQQDDQ